jgi:hypothetical protein
VAVDTIHIKDPVIDHGLFIKGFNAPLHDPDGGPVVSRDILICKPDKDQ